MFTASLIKSSGFFFSFFKQIRRRNPNYQGSINFNGTFSYCFSFSFLLHFGQLSICSFWLRKPILDSSVMALHIISINIFPCRWRHTHKRKHSALHYWSSSFWNHWIQHYARQTAHCGERKRAFVPQKKRGVREWGHMRKNGWMDGWTDKQEELGHNVDGSMLVRPWLGLGETHWLAQTFLMYTNNKRTCMKACPGVSQALCMCECSLTLCSLLVCAIGSWDMWWFMLHPCKSITELNIFKLASLLSGSF